MQQDDTSAGAPAPADLLLPHPQLPRINVGRAPAGSPAPLERAASGPLAPPSYRPRNILITGGAGFIGSHVARLLASSHPEYRLVVLDKLDYCASTSNLDGLLGRGRDNFRFVRGDILAADLVALVLRSEAIDTILHFAAQTHVDASFGNSLSFTRNNVVGTHVLLECARQWGGIRRFIHVSTDEVYGDSARPAAVMAQSPSFCGMQQQPVLGPDAAAARQAAPAGDADGADHDEAAQAAGGGPPGAHAGPLLQPINPYAAAKAGAELLVQAYSKSYGLPAIITRSSNVYGPHQFPEKVIPKFVMLALAGANLPIHGSGAAPRGYMYVSDAAAAYDVILHRGEAGEVYNIGGRHTLLTPLQIATDVRHYFGLPPERVVHVAERLFRDKRYLADDAKLVALGWRERVGWRQGLERTIGWYAQLGGAPGYWRDEGALRAALRADGAAEAAGGVCNGVGHREGGGE